MKKTLSLILALGLWSCGDATLDSGAQLDEPDPAGAGGATAPVLGDPEVTPGATETQSEGVCPSGDGAYCGGPVGLDADALYDCRGGEYTLTATCEVTCDPAPPGQPDGCRDPDALDPNTLVYPFNTHDGHWVSDNPAGHAGRTHQLNWDVTCTNRTAMGAVIGGKVITVTRGLTRDPANGYGNRVCIKNAARGLTVCQNHMGVVAVELNCEISAGEYIGTCSNSGYVISSHMEDPDAGSHVDIYAINNAGQNVSLPTPHSWHNVSSLAVVEDCGADPQEPDPQEPDPQEPDPQEPDPQEPDPQPEPAACPSGDGRYCGGSVGREGDTLYQCTRGDYHIVQHCAHGCQTAPAGQNDRCADAPVEPPEDPPEDPDDPPANTCPSGNGLYCGGPVGRDDDTLYRCRDGHYEVSAECAGGCHEAAAGQNDSCNGGCPSGNGLYCGETGGLDDDTLYMCSNGAWEAREHCGDGCFVAPAGQADRCN